MYGWEPGIGDPTLYGWLTVAAYGMAAWLCWRAGASGAAGERRLWRVFALLMAFLCINKQLDLQSLLTSAGRSIARQQGWYEQRRHYQLLFIILFAVAAIAVVAVLSWLFRRARWPIRGAVAGVTLLTLFVIVRASSFEKMDQLLNRHIEGWKANHAMELGGIAIVAACAWAAQRGSGRGSRRRTRR